MDDTVKIQHLCFQMMCEKYPSAGIEYPEGAAGDEGVDLFCGELTHGPTVWQCKAFQVTLIGKSQKAQILESLREAHKNVKPRVWVLCLNMNMDIKATRWFERLKQSYRRLGMEVADPIQGSDIARELMFRRTLRDQFVPGAGIDVREIKSLSQGG